MAWLTPALFQPGDAEMDILAAILSDGKDSLLYRRLVRELKIARDVDAYQYSTRLQGQFIIEATAAEGHTTDELVAEIDKILAELQRTGPDPEAVEVARINYEAGFFDGLQSIAAKANRLNSYNIMAGDPGYIDEDLARYRALTPAGVKAAAERLRPDARVVLHVTPEPPADDHGGEEAP